MVIAELAAIDFRNYSELRTSFGSGINVLVGSNGQGKSNLVEAIFFLLHLDSFRTHEWTQLLRQGRPLAQLQGMIQAGDMTDKVRVEISRKGRRVWWNEQPVLKRSAYVNRTFALVFNPDTLYLYRHVPAERRLFYNRFLSYLDGGYLRDLVQFRQIHAQKNGLLKSGNLSGLEAWNRLFAERSRAIMACRAAFVDTLNGWLPELFTGLTGRPDRLRLRYQPSFKGDPESFEGQLHEAQEQETRLGYARVGPHRDDYRMGLAPAEAPEGAPEAIDAARREGQFSQGEYRGALLALTLALERFLERRKGIRPIVILDDAFSELDARVRTAATAHLLGMPNQIFITTTERLDPFQAAGARILEIRAGEVAG
jgi:DNA replication and repair protein RecF